MAQINLIVLYGVLTITHYSLLLPTAGPYIFFLRTLQGQRGSPYAPSRDKGLISFFQCLSLQKRKCLHKTLNNLWNKNSQSLFSTNLHLLCENRAWKLDRGEGCWSLVICLSTKRQSVYFRYPHVYLVCICLVQQFCICHFHFFHKGDFSSISPAASLTSIQSLQCCRTGPLTMEAF